MYFVATVPGMLALATGAAMLTVGTVWELVRLRGDLGDDDPVTATVDAPGARGELRAMVIAAAASVTRELLS